MFAEAIKRFGTLHILVSNAGLQRDSAIEENDARPVESRPRRQFDRSVPCAREAVREFKRRGVVPSVSAAAGKIICMSSVHEVIPWAGHANYAASKGGVMLLMKSMAQELAPYRIRVNSIAPGAIRTPINRSAWSTSAAYADLMKLVPYGRIGEPEDIGALAFGLPRMLRITSQEQLSSSMAALTLYPGFATGG